ncbi:MAG: thermonuclease family protein [Acidimicrobiales bacterium]|nr:thermonuclease family protein [Acidimicrobiales bacterium]
MFALVILGGCARSTSPTTSADPTSTDPTSTDPTSTDPTSTALGAAATVVYVIDGDTIIVDLAGTDEHVRLIGIDTPEPSGGYRPAECHGDEASEFTKTLLPEGTPVLITRDAEPRDKYGRFLGYVHRAQDGLFINLTLVEQGHAAPLSIEPNTTFRTQFEQAAALARDADLGLWGACGGPDTPLDESLPVTSGS